LQFLWKGERYGLSPDQTVQLLFVGSELGLKFQVKLFKKGYFDTTSTVTSVEAVEDGQVRVTATFNALPASDREALDQFAADMEFLKRQLPS